MTNETPNLTLGQLASQPQKEAKAERMSVKEAIDSGIAENLKKVLESETQHAFAMRAPIADRMLRLEDEHGNRWQSPLSYVVAVGSADMLAVLLEAGAKVTPSIVEEAQEKYSLVSSANASPEAVSEESQKVKLLLSVSPKEKQIFENSSGSGNSVPVVDVSEKKTNQHMKLK